MAQANEQTVLGNFNNAKFTYAGMTSTFFKRDGKFFVNTDGRDGKLADYEIKYTFGVAPLQQYLVEFPDGRIQALLIAWDARPKKEGGQRWFHLYPNERITHDDELHWTGPRKTGTSCAPTATQPTCEKITIRLPTDSRPQWSEINVGCEACHGPARTIWNGPIANPPFEKGGQGGIVRAKSPQSPFYKGRMPRV